MTVIGIPDSGAAHRRGAGRAAAACVPRWPRTCPAAVRLARKLTPAGGVVLLSPAAPSYGRYRNFEHRSEAFAEAIRDTAAG